MDLHGYNCHYQIGYKPLQLCIIADFSKRTLVMLLPRLPLNVMEVKQLRHLLNHLSCFQQPLT